MENKDILDGLYTELYNSLGVEPGLLSKTKVGRELNEKFRDDSIDATMTAYKYMNDQLNYVMKNKTEEDKPTIEKYSIFPENGIGIAYGDSDVEIIEFKLHRLIHQFQIDNKLSTKEVVDEIEIFIKKYANNYFIKKEEE